MKKILGLTALLVATCFSLIGCERTPSLDSLKERSDIVVMSDIKIKDGQVQYLYESTLFSKDGQSAHFAPGQRIPFHDQKIEPDTQYGEKAVMFIDRLPATGKAFPFLVCPVYGERVPGLERALGEVLSYFSQSAPTEGNRRP